MKNIYIGFVGLFLVFGVASAATTPIVTATTNTARKQVYDITYGTIDPTTKQAIVDDQGYRKGVTPQTNELDAVRGTTTGTLTANTGVFTTNNSVNVAVGKLAAAATAVTSGSATVGYTGAPTKTISANTANVAVLQRDKLHVPTGDGGNCASGKACGYVTTGNAHTAGEKIWLQIVE